MILDRLDISQSNLQFGFTKSLSPTMASLLVSEANDAYSPTMDMMDDLLLATLDSQKAFDVVDHKILLDKLYQQDIHPDLWLIAKNMYEGLTTKVKWLNALSDSFPVTQGVRQGGVLSTVLYKSYVNDLLAELEENSLGVKIGDIYVGSPTCADDIALLHTLRMNYRSC